MTADALLTFVDSLAVVVVALVGAYLIGLALAAWFVPAQAQRFLLGFAGSAAKHYLELTLRIVAGAAFVWQAPRMAGSEAFNLFGWVLLLTTTGLLLVPWRWHRRFAERAVPQALRHLALIGLASLLFGSGVLLALGAG